MRAVARTFFIRKARRRINLMLCITVRHLTAAEHGRRHISSAPRRVRNPATLRITTILLSRRLETDVCAQPGSTTAEGRLTFGRAVRMMLAEGGAQRHCCRTAQTARLTNLRPDSKRSTVIMEALRSMRPADFTWSGLPASRGTAQAVCG